MKNSVKVKDSFPTGTIAIKDFPDYAVDADGTLYTVRMGNLKVRKAFTNKDGYLQLSLRNEKGPKTFQMHRLVLEAFKPLEGSAALQCNHMNGIKADNRLENLEWTTGSENLKHAFATGLANHKGTKNPSCTISELQAHLVCRLLQLKKFTSVAISKQLNISYYIVAKIRGGRSWKHISCQYAIVS